MSTKYKCTIKKRNSNSVNTIDGCVTSKCGISFVFRDTVYLYIFSIN